MINKRKINRLPVELLLFIFKNITDLKDLIKLREVNKLQSNLIDNNNLVNELSVNLTDYLKNIELQYFSKKLITKIINLNNSKLDKERIFKNKLISSKIVKNLKYLRIFFDNELHSNILISLNNLNRKIYYYS